MLTKLHRDKNDTELMTCYSSWEEQNILKKAIVFLS
jgi:hypothetical protein